MTATAPQFDIEQLQSHAGFAILSDRAFLRITGPDATRWLNGMVTNSIQALKPGEGNYNFLLSAQGRIQGDCTIYREAGEEPSYLLATSGSQIDTIQGLLDKFIIMDDVELTRAREDEQSLLFVGPTTPSLLQSLGLPDTPPLHCVLAETAPGTVLLMAGTPNAFPSFELRSTPGVVKTLSDKALSSGARELSFEDLEALRIASGVPHYSIDIRDKDLPQETNQVHALHFAKGCYLGQEIVERIRSRGQVHRLFTPFFLEGDMPTLPAPLVTNGKAAGELTSAARIGKQIYALGYARREALETKQPFTYSGGTATPRTIALASSIQEHETKHG